MSAPAFVIPAAPFMGSVAAPKRGAATADIDFAAMLDEAAPAEAPAGSTVAAAPKNETSAATAPVEDAAAEVVETASAVDGTIMAAPAPLAPAPALVVEALVVKVGVAETARTAPTLPADASPPPADEAAPVAAPNTAPADVADVEATRSAPALSDQSDLATVLPAQPRAAAASASPAAAPAAAAGWAMPVASPTPRPAKAAVETTTSTGTASVDDPPVVGKAALGTLETPAVPAEAPRTRDAIDRALANRTEAQGAGVTADAEAANPSGRPDAVATAAASTPMAKTAVVPASEPTIAPIPLGEDAVAAAPVASTAPPTEARAADPALSLALSTASHASIETTAQIAAQIVRKLEGRSTRFEMALTPEGLGNVDVSLDIDADGKLIAKMAFDNPLAATELRGRVDELRRQLQESGFTVADDALSFAERDASAGQQGGSAFDRRPDPRSARAFGAGARLSAEADIAAPSRWIPLTLTPDRVDMKV